MKTLQIGIIGLGKIGKLHAGNLIKHYRQKFQLKAVSDKKLDKDWLQTRGISAAVTSTESILNDPDIDAVLICSPSSTHVPLIIQAAKAGKHIFCEKPIALEVEAIERALAAVDLASVKLQIGFNRRFDPNFVKVQQNVADGHIGKPHLIRITSYDPAPPLAEYVAQSGGIFLDMTIHDFDMARFLTGSDIVEVYATGAVLIDTAIGQAGDVDTAIVQLRFANGALGAIDNSRQAVYGYDQRIEVFGSKASIAAENCTATNVTVSTVEGVSSDKPLYSFMERYKAAYIAELEAFYQCITNNTPSPVSGHDGLMPVIAGLAAKKSLATHQPVEVESRS